MTLGVWYLSVTNEFREQYHLQFCLIFQIAAKSKLCSTHLAVSSHDIPALTRLLVAGVDVNSYDCSQQTALHLACEQESPLPVALLLSSGAEANLPSDPDGEGCPPLLVAASHGRFESVVLLLRAGANVNATDVWGNSALFKSASGNHIETARRLLEYGADANQANNCGATPLQHAALCGYTDMAKLLLDGGALADARGDPNQLPPLAAAAEGGYEHCVSALVQTGADVNQSKGTAEGSDTADHSTPLYHALSGYISRLYEDNEDEVTAMSHCTCVRRLLSYGSRLSAACVDLLCEHTELLAEVWERHQAVSILPEVLDYLDITPGEQRFLGALFRACAVLRSANLIPLVCDTFYQPSAEDIALARASFPTMDFQVLSCYLFAPKPMLNVSKYLIKSDMGSSIDIPHLPLPVLLRDFEDEEFWFIFYNFVNKTPLLPKGRVLV